ncbi:RIS1 [Fusarium sp. NRRL 52700]|nr:RIS1 [Fusarium sp. NRRL 52700]
MKYPDDLSSRSHNKLIDKSKPGGRFAFKPQTTLSSKQQPDFSKLAPRHTHTHSKTRLSDSTALRDLGAMVNERAPPKVPLNSISPNGENKSRELSPDDDITALVRGMSSLKGKVRGDMSDPFNPANATNTPTFGHPTKMMSSRKQRADPFIRQKTRPEHHLDSRSSNSNSNSNNGARITGPRGPVYQDRRPPPMPMFSSDAPSAPPVASSYAPARHYGEETFYTDPAKASADLKALLEGGMEDGEEEGGQQSQADGEKKSEDSKDPKDGTVDGLTVKLLPHQVEGVEWMRGRELGPVKRGKVPKGGILADDMGLGKTLQTISLILTNQKPAKDAPGWKKHFEKIEKTTLVVAPLALIRQWEHEINDKVEKTHGLKVCVHHGPNRTKRFKELALYDVVITTYQILVSEHGNSSDADNGLKAGCFGLHWWRVVLDEAHTVKNRNAKATKACYALNSEYRWCLSGTPMQNNLDELQSLVKFLRIRPYDDLKEWKEHIDLPLKNGRGHIAIRRLHSLLRCFMKRRTKEILKEAGALNPGGKPSAEGEASSTGFKVTERKVVTISTVLSPAERKFYDRLAARADRSIEQMMQGRVNYANALTLLLRLRQACNHPKLVEGKLEKDKDAMSTDATQKTQDTDIDAMADMFADMGIVSKDCNICGRGLSAEDNKLGKDICSDCHDDLAYFNNHGRPERPGRPKKSKKLKDKSRKKDKKEMVDEKIIDRQIVEVDDDADDDDDDSLKTSGRPRHRNTVVDSDDEDAESPKKTARQPRNRNAIVDSDDEEEEAEGSWLIPEEQQGSIHLGKAGGEEDENAEGGGDWIGSDDSEDEESKVEDKSNLSSFIENDDSRGDVASDSDDSLASLTDITKRMAAQTLDDGPSHAADTKSVGTDADTTAADTTAADTTAVSGSSASDSVSDSNESDISSEEDDSIFYPSRDPNSPQVLASSKIRELIKILQDEVKEHKFIVFSQFTSMLDLVEPFFRKERFRFVRYDGSMKNDQREESLRKLRGDPQTRILLCSLKCGSLGLNLTAATRVVILEPFWNPFVEEQAIDRVHRLTQTVDVIIYKLTVAQTVEERILELQEKKRELAEQAIEGGMRKEALKLGINEIINLFKPGSSENPVIIGAESSAVGHESFNGNERRTAASSQRRPGRPRKEESEVYGRRW